ncbi:hypothetical protein [Mycolicibacterium houstonense]|uniref:hypothetical protein n=1 Tax=Mycolicibacterium houstonense TaxID=146021 RepID=UPI003F95F22D
MDVTGAGALIGVLVAAGGETSDCPHDEIAATVNRMVPAAQTLISGDRDAVTGSTVPGEHRSVMA